MQGPRLAWALGVVVLSAFTIYSAGSMTHGFVSYYAASKLLLAGQLGPDAYDDSWFGAYVQQVTRSSVREIFIPNPPPMALMAVPVAPLDAAPARAAWLLLSLAAFAIATRALVQWAGESGRRLPVTTVLLMVLAPAVFTNLRIGQGYLFVFALFAFAVINAARRRDLVAGALLGALLALKTSGVALLLLLLAKRRWRAIAAALVVMLLIALIVTPFIDPRMWLVYPDHVRAYVARPASSVTAYQTTLSLFRRLCVADPVWNPQPAASCAPLAFVMPLLLIAAATIVTAFAAIRSAHASLWLAPATALSVLALPAVAEPHFVLMAIPLAILTLRPTEFALIAALLLIPLEATAERFTSGWAVVFAYPRLYAAWLLWAAGIKELLKPVKP